MNSEFQGAENLIKNAGQRFFAYEIHSPNGMPISNAPLRRAWMDETDQRFAYRCLPLLLANTAGWLISCPANFSVWWNGGARKEDLTISFPPGSESDNRVHSHFGHGVLTFSLPYLFRTPQGINLWVKGPTNWPKDSICALEGIVETDWANATFTMNWKLTRANSVVSFSAGEPICMVIPVLRGLAEALEPVQAHLEANPELQAAFGQWERSRDQFLKSLHAQEPEAMRRGWEKDYFKGVQANGESAKEHQSHIALREFSKTAKATFPHIKPNFISKQECERIINVIRCFESSNGDFRPSRRTDSRVEIPARFLHEQGLGDEAAFLHEVRQRCTDYANWLRPTDAELFPEFSLLQANYRGDGHCRHADNKRYCSEQNAWIANHTPQRAVSCCLYLNRCNEDFTGGELMFPALKMKVTPEPGTLVAFPSDERFEHEVPTITDGARYSLLIWLTENETLYEHLLPSQGFLKEKNANQ